PHQLLPRRQTILVPFPEITLDPRRRRREGAHPAVRMSPFECAMAFHSRRPGDGQGRARPWRWPDLERGGATRPARAPVRRYFYAAAPFAICRCAAASAWFSFTSAW